MCMIIGIFQIGCSYQVTKFEFKFGSITKNIPIEKFQFQKISGKYRIEKMQTVFIYLFISMLKFSHSSEFHTVKIIVLTYLHGLCLLHSYSVWSMFIVLVFGVVLFMLVQQPHNDIQFAH